MTKENMQIVKNTTENTKNFTFYLNEATVSELSEISKEIGFSRSKAVERAIKRYIKNYKETGEI